MTPSSHESYDVSIMGQQALELLDIDGREHKQIFSHMIHDVAGGGDGIISLTLDDRGYFHLGRNFLCIVAL